LGSGDKNIKELMEMDRTENKKSIFLKILFIRLRERENKRGAADRSRGRRLPAEQGAQCGTRFQDPGTMT